MSFFSNASGQSCLVVMQPTFIPWAGYFNLIAQADDFVFLDDVQLEKQSWQTRNRLIINGNVQWVSVPVRHERMSQTIAETQVVDSTKWRRKLATGFALNYGKHPYYADARELVDLLVDHPVSGLAALNEKVIRHAAMRMGLTTRLHRSSELEAKGTRTERLVSLCKIFNARRYLSPAGALDYLNADGFSKRTTTKLYFQEYLPEVYPQKECSIFQTHLSILDVVANIGWQKTKIYVKG